MTFPFGRKSEVTQKGKRLVVCLKGRVRDQQSKKERKKMDNEKARVRPKRKRQTAGVEMRYDPCDDLTIEVDQCLEKLILPSRIPKTQQDIIFAEMHTLLKPGMGHLIMCKYLLNFCND